MRIPHRCDRGAALVEAALCLALFTPLVFAALRLAYGANQMHELANAVTEGARAGSACAAEEDIRRIALRNAPGRRPSDVSITIDRSQVPARIRVSIENARISRLYGTQALAKAPSAVFPYLCD